MKITRLMRAFGCLAVVFLGVACDGKKPEAPEVAPAAASTSSASKPAAAAATTGAGASAGPKAPAADPKPAKIYWNAELFQQEVKYHNPDYAGGAQAQIEGGE